MNLLRRIRLCFPPFRMACCGPTLMTAALLLGGSQSSISLAADAPKPAGIPTEIMDAKDWGPADQKGNTPSVGERDGTRFVTAAGRQLLLVTPNKLGPDQRVQIRFRLNGSKLKAGLGFSAGLTNATDLKERGIYVSISPGTHGVGWNVFDPTAKGNRPEVNGLYRPQFHAERSLGWPETLRANVEADLVASLPIEKRIITLDIVLRSRAYEVSLDGIPLTRVSAEQIETNGFARLNLPPNFDLLQIRTERVAPYDPNVVHQPVSLQSILNASQINGAKLDHKSLSAGALQLDGVPFEIASPNAEGNDHVDIGASWFRQANLPGRYSGRGADTLTGRWAGALIKDPARLIVRLPMARYRALHLLAAADDDSDSVPVITAQFYRAQAGFPKNFEARVPAFSATAKGERVDRASLSVKTTSGKAGRLFHVTIPIEPGALAEFDDMDLVDVELTKQVQLYRASPDPMYYSFHAAGLPSSVHLYSLTTERPAVEMAVTASAYGHIWTAPEKPSYSVTLKNRTPQARNVQLELNVTSHSGKLQSNQKKTVKLPANQEAVTTFEVQPSEFGYHNLQLTMRDGSQEWTESRSLAFLREDTRERGDWDFGRGPLFGFWNWGGGHNTPSAAKQLLVMAKAGIESTPGSFEEYTARHGEDAKRVMEQYKIFTMKFAGAGDHYVTARFATDLKKDGLEKARETFVKTLRDRRSQPGPNSRPLFLSYYAEPSIGPLTHGIFPHFIGEPDSPLSDYEQERYQLFLNGFVEGAKIVRKEFPEVKNMLPHGDPAFVIHFLRQNPEIAKLLDGITVDIPCFERLPEQQFHQVSLHRLYMVRKEMDDAGVKKPLLPMYEGPCVPSGPGALTDQEHSDITIRNSLLLMAYGVDVQNGGLPGFDCASYWGEQHYGFGILNRISLETPKPAYTALATMTRHLNRANFNKWVSTGSQNTYALQFKHYRTGKLVHVMWTLRGERPVTIATAPGEKVVVFDQNDNPMAVSAGPNGATFTVSTSPCYVEGLNADARITLGEPNHRDAQPSSLAKKLSNFGDGSWTIASKQEKEYEESHKPYIYRFSSPMTAKATDAPANYGGRALAVNLQKPEKDRVFVPYYSVLTPAKPIEIPGKASHLGLWVRAQGDWGRAVYFVRDAKGELWISIGTRGQWNCDDIHSWSSFNFDGWRYLRMEMPSNSPYDQFREAGKTWWGPYSSGDGNIDLPLTLEKVVIERRTHVMYVNSPVAADPSDVLLGDLFAEYAAASDATSAAIQLANVRMPAPRDVPGLGNPIADLAAEGVGPALKIERITLPTQEVDGTQCFVHFPTVPDAKQYDVWVAPYEDGRGALQLGKAWKAPGQLIRGLRPNQPFYLFVTYTDANGKVSKPSTGFKIQLEDFFGMK